MAQATGILKRKVAMRISNAYDAYWFLMEHPKMRCRAAILVDDPPGTVRAEKGERIRRVRDEMPWAKDRYYLLREFRLKRNALECNLSIFWAKVNDRGRVGKDESRNVIPECWLEFGPIKQGVSDGHLHVMHYHDPRLDCGAATFDKAIVKLAKLVKKHYGDFKAPKWI